MKICSPKIILYFLIILFLVLNTLFFIQYLFGRDNDQKIVKNKYREEEFLKTYVDFNNTTFENKGKVYFYYPANKKIGFNTDTINFDTNSNEILPSNAYLNKSKLIKQCEFYYDDNNNLFIDSNGNICNGNQFDLNNSDCCIAQDNSNNQTLFRFNYNKCDSLSKCCEEEYMCIFNCLRYNIKETDPIHNFRQCKNSCRLNYLTINYNFKYCYYNVDKISHEKTSHLEDLSKENESCDEFCQLRSKRCFNHVLANYNNCKYILKENFIENCNKCVKMDVYGAGLISNYSMLNLSTSSIRSNLTQICVYSDDYRISCNYKQANLRRLCICI